MPRIQRWFSEFRNSAGGFEARLYKYSGKYTIISKK